MSLIQSQSRGMIGNRVEVFRSIFVDLQGYAPKSPNGKQQKLAVFANDVYDSGNLGRNPTEQ